MHSCRPYALELHFEEKPGGKLLYEKFKHAVKKQVGSFEIESLAHDKKHEKHTVALYGLKN
jgi:hypothetical protein